MPDRILVVGAGPGGLRVVEELRRSGHHGRIDVVGGEAHQPYDRPPLSKQLLSGAWDTEQVMLKDATALEGLKADLHLGTRVAQLEPGRVALADGTRIAADAIVLAPGIKNRVMPGQPATAYSLRSLDDALALRRALGSASSMLIVGAGFIGAEVASTAVQAGVSVTMVEAAPAPLLRGLGTQVGAMAGRLMTDAGVDLRTGTALRQFINDTTVRTVGGEIISADLVLVGIGGTPDVAWLADTGIDLTDGIACDDRGRVLGLEGVWAIGDAAAWDYPDHGGRHRHEHWNSAMDQAVAVARSLTGASPPVPTPPYFWSDQFGLKIQVVGRPDRADSVTQLVGEGLSGGTVKGTVIGYFRHEHLVATAGFGAARHLARLRTLVLTGAHRAEVVDALAATAC